MSYEKFSREWAEETVVAAQLGLFHGTRSELAHAYLIMESTPRPEESK